MHFYDTLSFLVFSIGSRVVMSHVICFMWISVFRGVLESTTQHKNVTVIVLSITCPWLQTQVGRVRVGVYLWNI